MKLFLDGTLHNCNQPVPANVSMQATAEDVHITYMKIRQYVTSVTKYLTFTNNKREQCMPPGIKMLSLMYILMLTLNT